MLKKKTERLPGSKHLMLSDQNQNLIPPLTGNLNGSMKREKSDPSFFIPYVRAHTV